MTQATRQPASGTAIGRRSIVARISTLAAVILVSMGAGGGPGAGSRLGPALLGPDAGAEAGPARKGSGGSSAATVTDSPAAAAAFTPSNVALSVELVEDGFDSPVLVTNAGDGSGRLFVVEQSTGLIRIIAGGSTLATPFLDLHTSISTGGERGMLGLAFHPSYPSIPYFYVSFTDVKGSIAVTRFQVSADPNVADRSSGVRFMTIRKPYANHNGGNIAFGPAGYLYIGTGDGGAAGDPGNRAQDLNELLGKMLRIDVNHSAGSKHYRSPATNPYVGRAGLDEIWARGLRNPWRWSFDRATGALWIGDVGQKRYEEIDRSLKTASAQAGRGLNYGWHTLEGRVCYSPPTGCSTAGRTMPIAAYSHVSTGDDNCAVTGGFVYRGTADPVLRGGYVYGDFCSGRIWVLPSTARYPAVGTLVRGSTVAPRLAISSFGEDEAGELYLCDLAGGAIYRIRASPKA